MAILVSALGFSESQVRSLSTAFSNRAKNKIELCEQSKASVFLVDLDAIGGPDKLEQLNIKSYHTVVVSNDNLPAFKYQIKKPMGFTTLVSAIEKAWGGDAKDVEPTDTSKLVEISPAKTEPLHPLLDKLRQEILLNTSKQKKSLRRFYFTDSKWLELDFMMGVAKSNIKARGLMSLLWASSDDFKDIKWVKRSHKQSSQIETAMLFEHLLWETTGHGKNNHLIREIDYRYEYQLRRWPDLPKLHFSEEVYALIAYWIKNPSTISALWKKFPSARKPVIRLANQCAVCGLLNQVEQNNVKVIESSSKVPSAFHKIFGMLLNKINKEAS